MPEDVRFETEQYQSRAEIATYLRTVADRLDAGEALSLEAGDQQVTLDVPNRVEFEIKAERETSRGGGSPEHSVEFELEWDESDEGDGESSLSIT